MNRLALPFSSDNIIYWKGSDFMDIIIMLIITIMFLRMIIRGKITKADFAMWALICVLVLILFKIHATSTLPISL
ncbi:hypothetical protein FC27_GL002061 [Companilactobacillus versmoldensis DSM 14857 = KCTC 3814]|uniref:Uncharacterized protein n=2 Tax=Companilactobacillus versmoldensis TaxID=194326 RepID=A0A0R1SF50_9LACO|nr:hypothetical protein FC27_GL002061 [Companilactobacillus versmoldensis DSM 14857 = KCTC 3814]